MKKLIVVACLLWAGVAVGAEVGTGSEPQPDSINRVECIYDSFIRAGQYYNFLIDGKEYEYLIYECTPNSPWIMVRAVDKKNFFMLNLNHVSRLNPTDRPNESE